MFGMPLLPPWLHNVMPALPILLLAVCQQLPSGPGCHLWAVLSLCCPSLTKGGEPFLCFHYLLLYAGTVASQEGQIMLSPVLFLVWYSNALMLPNTHPYKHPISPPPPKKNNNNNNIYTPPTTETVHLSRLMRVHYNCCPFHKPASGVTDTF